MHQNNIAILLSTYNGEKYIIDQLNSLENQSCQNFDVLIRDDGSTDATTDLIQQFQRDSKLSIILLGKNKNLGAMKSFEFLLQYALVNLNYKYFMFCDQDDVWLENKVLNSFEKINQLVKQYDSHKGLLIYTDLHVVDEKLNRLGDSFWEYFNLCPKKNSLNYLCMQCNVTGCTMIFNRALAELSLPFASRAVMHDHWLGLVATSMGHIDYLNKATIEYRQHGSNVSGGADKFNINYIVRKAFKYFNANEFEEVLGRQIKQAEAFLLQYQPKLSNENIEILEAIIKLKTSSFFKRIGLVVKYRLYKHGIIRNIGLFLWLFKVSSECKK